jgi:hypothetical protein
MQLWTSTNEEVGPGSGNPSPKNGYVRSQEQVRDRPGRLEISRGHATSDHEECHGPRAVILFQKTSCPLFRTIVITRHRPGGAALGVSLTVAVSVRLNRIGNRRRIVRR